jgi:protein SCO1/2
VETPPRFGFLPQTPVARAVALVSVVVVVAILGYWTWRNVAGDAVPTIGGSFALTDQFGKPRTDADFRGQYMLVFFGFTNCPDICPIELQTMSDALDLLGADAAKVTPIFITVDPARDTQEMLRDYVANFHPRLVALTGDAAAIGTVAKRYRVYYAKATGANAPSDPAAYIMDHTAIVYLMGPDSGYLTHFNPGTTAEAMAQGVRGMM